MNWNKLSRGRGYHKHSYKTVSRNYVKKCGNAPDQRIWRFRWQISRFRPSVNCSGNTFFILSVCFFFLLLFLPNSLWIRLKRLQILLLFFLFALNFGCRDESQETTHIISFESLFTIHNNFSKCGIVEAFWWKVSWWSEGGLLGYSCNSFPYSLWSSLFK